MPVVPEGAVMIRYVSPAFPGKNSFGDDEPGMSLRDYFAAVAVAACIERCVPHECEGGETMAEMFARKAYIVADAMLAEREKSK